MLMTAYNQSKAKEVKDLMYTLSNEGNLRKFDEIIAFGGILCEKKGEGEYNLNKQSRSRTRWVKIGEWRRLENQNEQAT